MSTRCRIGIEREDGTVESIYCHLDGYIKGGVGETLQKHYDTKEKVEALIALGDISILGDYYDPELSKGHWKYDGTSHGASTVTYNDRGEDTKSHIDKDRTEYVANTLPDSWAEFGYLWAKDLNGRETWLVVDTPTFLPLDMLIPKENPEKSK